MKNLEFMLYVEGKEIKLASIAVFLAVFLTMIVRVLFFYNSPDSVLIGVIPDDAFYYMQMAKHRTLDGFWSFDGTSAATGFHFLYGYFLVFMYSVFGEIGWRQLFLIIGGSASFFIALAAYLTSRTAEDIFGRKSILLAVAPFFTAPALMQSTVMMESWLVLFFSSATIYFLAKDRAPFLSEGIALTILGTLGSLSRTDYGLLPGVIFSTYLISRPFIKSHGLKRSGFVLAGAIIGVAIVLAHNLYVSGQLAQASAQTKFYWSSVFGHSITAPVNLVMSIALPFYGVLGKITVALCVVGIACYFWRKANPTETQNSYHPNLIITTGSFLTVLAYIYFYRYNSQALQIWYSSNFIAPIGITIAATGFLLFRSTVLIPAIFLFFAYAADGFQAIFTAPWPHQAGMMQAGLFLKEKKQNAVYGSWNAGIISYFSEVVLINIDGLTNDDVLPFIKSNTLFDYIKYRNINYLIDYEVMLNSGMFRIKGGYLDERIDRCLRPLEAIDGDSPSWGGGRVRLFEVIKGCG